jgi:hypothetical protein
LGVVPSPTVNNAVGFVVVTITLTLNTVEFAGIVVPPDTLRIVDPSVAKLTTDKIVLVTSRVSADTTTHVPSSLNTLPVTVVGGGTAPLVVVVNVSMEITGLAEPVATCIGAVPDVVWLPVLVPVMAFSLTLSELLIEPAADVVAAAIETTGVDVPDATCIGAVPDTDVIVPDDATTSSTTFSHTCLSSLYDKISPSFGVFMLNGGEYWLSNAFCDDIDIRL